MGLVVTTTYTIRIPDWRPPSLNATRNRHWSREAKAKAVMAEVLGTYKALAGIPDITGRVRLSVMITYSGRRRPMDVDNVFGKLFRDSLKAAHLLRDDSPRWLEEGTFSQERGERTETRIVLEVDAP